MPLAKLPVIHHRHFKLSQRAGDLEPPVPFQPYFIKNEIPQRFFYPIQTIACHCFNFDTLCNKINDKS
jgi:hypothetical protein